MRKEDVVRQKYSRAQTRELLDKLRSPYRRKEKAKEKAQQERRESPSLQKLWTTDPRIIG